MNDSNAAGFFALVALACLAVWGLCEAVRPDTAVEAYDKALIELRRVESERILAEADRQSTAILAAQLAVSMQLRDPASAVFLKVRAIPTPSGYAVCGMVNAKNGFGGYAGTQKFVVTAENVVLEEKAASALDVSWAKYCGAS